MTIETRGRPLYPQVLHSLRHTLPKIFEEGHCREQVTPQWSAM